MAFTVFLLSLNMDAQTPLNPKPDFPRLINKSFDESDICSVHQTAFFGVLGDLLVPPDLNRFVCGRQLPTYIPPHFSRHLLVTLHVPEPK